MLDVNINVVTNLIGAALMVTLLISNKLLLRSKMIDSKIFMIMINLTLFQCIVEMVAFLIDGKMFVGAVWVSKILNTYLFSANIIFACLWTVYVDYKIHRDMNRIKKRYRVIALPTIIIVIMAIANLFTDVFYSVSAENVYSRTDLFMIPFVATYCYLIYSLIMAHYTKNNGNKYMFMPVLVFMAPIFIGSVLQALFYGISLLWVSVAIAMVTLYESIQNEVTYLDALTGIYNRLYLNYYLDYAKNSQKPNYRLAGLIGDMNDFKAINDNYGHAVGDKVLMDVAEILKNVTIRRDAVAVRYGGDEFVVLKLVSDQSEILAIAEEINGELEKYNRDTINQHKVSLSIGTGIYKLEEDNIDTFLKKMDEDMYEKKRNRTQFN